MRKPPAWATRPQFSWLDLIIIIIITSAVTELVKELPAHIQHWVYIACYALVAFFITWNLIRRRRKDPA